MKKNDFFSYDPTYYSGNEETFCALTDKTKQFRLLLKSRTASCSENLSKLLLMLFSLIVLSSFSLKDNMNQTHPNEIIVAFENLSNKQLIELDEAIAQIPSVKNFGYCQKLKLYFFSYDEKVYPGENEAMDAITIHTKKFHPILKIGTSSEQIAKNCNNN